MPQTLSIPRPGRVAGAGSDPGPATGRASATPRQLPAPAAFVLLASTVLTLLASSSAPTPLYAVYQARWGFSDVMITVTFGVYAVAVLVALLSAGSLSDHIGRRPVLLGALVIQAAVMVLFATADGLGVLLLARVLQGLATGAALGAIGAGLVDLHPGRGPVANAAGAMAGTASGALGSALLVQLLPAPTQLVYLVLGAIFLLQALGIALIAETSPRVPGALRALAPTVGIPPRVRPALLVAVPSLVAVWALAGFYGSLGPALVGHIGATHSTVLGGASLFALAISGAVTVLAFHRTPAERFALVGAGLMVTGVAIVLGAIAAGSLGLFFLGSVIAGAGFGAGFQGGLRTVIPLAAAHERAGVISVVYIVSYLAMGLPAMLAGVAVEHSALTHVAEIYGAAVILLAGVTGIGLLSLGRRRADSPAPAVAGS